MYVSGFSTPFLCTKTCCVCLSDTVRSLGLHNLIHLWVLSTMKLKVTYGEYAFDVVHVFSRSLFCELRGSRKI